MTEITPPQATESSTPETRRLPDAQLLSLYEMMVEGRVLEERLILMQRQGEGYFWIGGPGEEAFNISLGLLANKGSGLDHDYLHLHYRSSGTLLGMGAPSIDALRQMHNTATDPYSGGRNFVGHFSKRAWNLVPITSPIEVQYQVAIGTALAQARQGGKGITIVQGGDAGTAEGDFASSLVWASRPAQVLPMLIIVTNNGYGISTEGHTQHGEKNIADRGKPFGMHTSIIDANDTESAYFGLQDALEYVRTTRKPMVLEARVSRLYGHSSSSGSNYVEGEVDCLKELTRTLIERGLRTQEQCDALREEHQQRMQADYKTVLGEPYPEGHTVWDHVFADVNHVGGES